MLIIRASLRVLAPQMGSTVDRIVEEEFIRVGWTEVTLTSAYRPQGAGSVHPYGCAKDYDSAQANDNEKDPRWKQVSDRVAFRLGPEYDVLAHKGESGKMHLHVEYDPR